jgi:diguanylate cyclase (GGDEF)-like protein
VPAQDSPCTPQTFVQAADTEFVSGTALSALARLAERRFSSFSEAADTVLDLLEAELPPGSLLLGRVDWDEGELRLVDVRGAAAKELQAGSTLPLAEGATSGSSGLLDPQALQRLSVRSYLALPLDSSAGPGALTLCALSEGTDVFAREHLELLSVAGRLLIYEWESVKWRADLRRLSERLRDPERTDSVTGLLNRTAFVEAVEREWRLAERGTLETYVLAFDISNIGRIAERHGGAVGELLLKDAADVMQTAIRRTDHAGRIADGAFGAVLVGCKGLEGAAAFIGRYGQALERATQERPAQLEVAYAICSLGDAESPEAALDRIEAEARTSAVALAGEAA